MTEQPGMDTNCRECGHKYHVHYTCYDGSKQGCSFENHVGGNQFDYDIVKCNCGGFAVRLNTSAVMPSHGLK